MKTVEAVKTPEQIAASKGLLRSYSSSDLYVDVWTFGLNTALRMLSRFIVWILQRKKAHIISGLLNI